MPTYEYACRDCGEHLEVVQSFKDDPLTVCPACEGSLRKVFSAAGIVFKGSGWHIKDYASSPSGADAPAESSGSKDPKDPKDSKDSKASTGSDSGASDGGSKGSATSTSSDGERKTA